MSDPSTGYVVVSWWADTSRNGTKGSYEYEHYTDRRDAFEAYDEYGREEYARARPVGIFEAINGLPVGGRLIHPAIAPREPAQAMAQRLEKAAAQGLRTQAPWPVGNGGLDECAGEGEVI